MGSFKKIMGSLLGLLIALIALQLVLRALKHVPVVGALANDADNLARNGTIAG